MKKYLYLLAFIFVANNITFAQNVNTPNANVEPYSGQSTDLSFDSPNDVGADGYIIVATNIDDPNFIFDSPVDFTDYMIGDPVGSGQVVGIISNSNQESFEINGLLSFTNYDIAITPFIWDGLNQITAEYFELNQAFLITLTPPVIELRSQSDDLIGCFAEKGRIIGVGPTVSAGDLSYQWYKDGEKIEDTNLFEIDDNEAGLLFDSLIHDHSGIYYVNVYSENFPENSGVRSRDFVVNVIQNPEITTQPMSQKALLGEDVALSVQANIFGEQPPSYRTNVQWYKGNTALENDDKIAGAQSSLLTISDVDQDDLSDDYWVMLTGYCGSVSSSTVSVSESEVVNVVDAISTDKAEYCDGEVAVISVGAEASEGSPLNYDWYRDGTILSEESGTLNFEVEAGVTNTISVDISLADGSGLMVTETIDVYGKIGASISNTFGDIEIEEGDANTLTVEAAGDDIDINWYNVNDLTTSLSNSNTFDLSGLLEADSGSYVVEVSNDCNTVLSDEFMITITNSDVFASVALENKYQLVASPNPTQSTSEISFNLDVASDVRIELFTATGNKVAVLIDGFKSAGTQSITVNPNQLNLTTGVYFYTLTSGENQLTKQLIITK